ncbi:hypothetical protein Afil01_17890 [Actinorhabdospora filicis]|uniref:Uncharacterized protein n=1 Tax=Actinorhabdospora filicis TaxID=1785913 RepID=A0A9W6SJJ9_9ACTN|nr:hypothetical protein [Actinorhabdospora filicis]GLZ76982.1 hypothetical protein Afil01_17890 [Actinorhabdospora filicis]
MAYYPGETPEQRRKRAAKVMKAICRGPEDTPAMDHYAWVFASLGKPLPTAAELIASEIPIRPGSKDPGSTNGLVGLLTEAGWNHVRRNGGCMQFTNPSEAGLVTMGMRPTRAASPGVTRSVLEVAGLAGRER